MIGSLALFKDAAELPVELGAARLHARVDSTDDAYLDALIGAATTHVETICGRSLVSRTYDWSLPGFPGAADDWCLRVPKPPLISVTSITYLDTAGASQVLATTVYEAVDLAGRIAPGLIVLKPDQEWPDVQSDKARTVTIRFVAGYGAVETVPLPIKQAILILVAHWYAAREPIITGTIVADVPLSVNALLAPYVVRSFG